MAKYVYIDGSAACGKTTFTKQWNSDDIPSSDFFHLVDLHPIFMGKDQSSVKSCAYSLTYLLFLKKYIPQPDDTLVLDRHFIGSLAYITVFEVLKSCLHKIDAGAAADYNWLIDCEENRLKLVELTDCIKTILEYQADRLLFGDVVLILIDTAIEEYQERWTSRGQKDVSYIDAFYRDKFIARKLYCLIQNFVFSWIHRNLREFLNIKLLDLKDFYEEKILNWGKVYKAIEETFF